MKLVQGQTNQTLFSNLQVADTFTSRSIGLLGRSGIAETDALLIKRCNSIHTFFMRFAIDALFVDKNGRVQSVRENIQPFRLILPQWSACDTIETAAGRVKALNIQVGDTLHVVS